MWPPRADRQPRQPYVASIPAAYPNIYNDLERRKYVTTIRFGAG
jgi:hypothetical protein